MTLPNDPLLKASLADTVRQITSQLALANERAVFIDTTLAQALELLEGEASKEGWFSMAIVLIKRARQEAAKR